MKVEIFFAGESCGSLEYEPSLGFDVFQVSILTHLSKTHADGMEWHPELFHVVDADGKPVHSDETFDEFVQSGKDVITVILVSEQSQVVVDETIIEGHVDARSTLQHVLASTRPFGVVPVSVEWDHVCSKVHFGDKPLVQPCFVRESDAAVVCLGCGSTPCVSDKYLPVGIEMPPFTCKCGANCMFLEQEHENVGDVAEELLEQLKTLAEGHREGVQKEEKARMEQKVSRYTSLLEDFEDEMQQTIALSLVPVDELNSLVDSEETSEGLTRTVRFLLRLLHWFKHSFFTWSDAPSCKKCGAKTKFIGTVMPTTMELKDGAHRVENYKCETCGSFTRFPRFNDVSKLLETRCGRSTEWALMFLLICRALQFEARLVVADDSEDVWVEVYVPDESRWVHCDPTRELCDAPLIYTDERGKVFTYVIAFSAIEIADVTKRYIRKWSEVARRRVAFPEEWLAEYVSKIRREIHTMRCSGNMEYSLAWIEERSMNEQDELERKMH
eukprot:TRINITY_DN883_c0_g1_i1.p1 TRINITY_DN883_c0_g1~~TRINITY_DN883_c0_g1_i1.p1  ORF type:complete len:499 (-),score=127.48 TRINITY_DN883_c0_g1_i1:2396-3892(-)